MVTGGLLGQAAEAYAKHNRVELSPHEEARSNAESKAKYFFKTVGNGLLMLSYTCEDPRQKAVLRRQGLIFNTIANTSGAVGIMRYVSRATSTIKKVRQAR